MAPANRWYLVLQRYISYLTARIEGLGGDPNAIPPSPDGAPHSDAADKVLSFTGKVAEIVYDCFGHFDGFVLSECCGNRTFQNRDWGIEKVISRACRHRLLFSVFVERGKENCIRKLVIRC